jgi:hypothetical protein
VKGQDVTKFGGVCTTILRKYNSSLIKALLNIYPDYPWHPWKFESPAPKGFWTDIQNQKKYFDWLGEQLGVKTMDDWYNVKYSSIVATGAFYINCIST